MVSDKERERENKDEIHYLERRTSWNYILVLTNQVPVC